jgi:nucleoside phosphorylase
MPNAGLIVALNTEVPFLFRNTSIVHQLYDHLIKVEISGIGQKRAGKKTKSFCEKQERFYPDYLINLGFCGATKDGLNIGDLVIANRLSYNNREIQLTNIYIDNVKEIFQGTKHYIGKLQTFDWPVISRSRVCEDTLAVDMESFAIGETSMKYQMPIIVIKVVSDIVPKKVNVKNLWYQLRSIINNKRYVQNQLNEFVKHYFYKSGNSVMKNTKDI